MGARLKKKGTTGAATNYITRTRAVRKLQISLPDFRRLCIFKGIYPREPRNKKKVTKGATPATTFYYTKDIQYLLHEPLIAKFREHKALGKKISRALGRGEAGDAARLEKTLKPKIALDHIIKERYPTFVDALRDLDDALSMLFLFANLPSHTHIPSKTIELCQRLCLEFEHYLIVSHSLRKSFLSIKGIYYQATIQGQDIMWLVPYKFVQNVSGDIDFRIMGTFIEFYTTLLGFVNYRLYTSIGLVYPPKFNAASDEAGGELGAFTLEGRAVVTQELNGQGRIENGAVNEEATAAAQAQADKIAAQQSADIALPTDEAQTDMVEEVTDGIDTFETTGADADILPQPQASSSEIASLFADYTFYLSRETPRQPLEFILKAFGCKRVGWDSILGDGAYVTDESDPLITHQIVDRPQIASEATQSNNGEGVEAPVTKLLWPRAMVPGRTYVQPQWVWDCINQAKLLRPDIYSPGAQLPPHLSPWVKPKKGAYDPTVPLEEQERVGEADEYDDDADVPAPIEGAADQSQESDEDVIEGESDEDDVDMDVASDNSDSDSEDAFAAAADAAAESDFEGFEDEESEDEATKAQIQHQRELEAEAAGLPAPAAPTPLSKAEAARKKHAKKQREEQEEEQRNKMMMSRKKRKTYERMQYGNEKRSQEAEKIRAKKRKLEKGKQTS
ncbi:hypothetical protein EJ05DRAFT_456509 [Pseudovirgaria hyperparasitica]|uniref:Pescadillo homolog n=1 Tax=Pseudovirgaria hyperparasitica TaxID=470096 RepID=A0A6A6VXH4_9PEZI|nr:uncharacterized protein EJ05DRAFT_456509 [Pseudovirgaria hyperparasitica]KAF2754394.1 hypothetical protein EJ05DRAFT_456509 [Pseudovirgaria hyperparasitica]